MPPKCIAGGRYRPNATRDTSRSVSAIMRRTTEIVRPVGIAVIPDGELQTATKIRFFATRKFGREIRFPSQTDSDVDFGGNFRVCLRLVFYALFRHFIGHRLRSKIAISAPREFGLESHAPIIRLSRTSFA